MLDEPLKEGEGPKINGSVMLAQADSKEEVMDKLRSDPYWKNGVWEEGKVRVNCWNAATAEERNAEGGTRHAHRQAQDDEQVGEVKMNARRVHHMEERSCRCWRLRWRRTCLIGWTHADIPTTTDPDLPFQERDTTATIATVSKPITHHPSYTVPSP